MNKKVLSTLPAILLALLLLPALFSIFRQSNIAHAATFTVDTFLDENDGDCDISSCSIRDAIAEAVDGDDITIPAGTYTLSAMNGPLLVTETLTFNGNIVADTIIDAQGNSRVFNVTAGTATFNDLIIQGGDATGAGGGINATGAASLAINNSVITNNNATTNGGGIAITNGTIDLTNSQVLSNTAGNNGGGIFSNNGDITFTNSEVLTNTTVGNGGGIALNLPSASLVMHSGQINDNMANTTSGFPGGGVFIAQGSLTLNDGEIRNNQAFRGGGILISGGVSGGSAIINGGQIIDNEATYGGGIYVRDATATLTINGGEITENRSTDAAVFGGGGLYIFQGSATMNEGTISLNTAAHDGGAMEIAEGSFTLNGGSIFNNSASNLGGAIYNDRGLLTINGGTIHTNNSTSDGGGIATGEESSSTIANSAILTNTAAANNGGGIANAGTLTMTNVTLSGNSAGVGAGLFISSTASISGTAVLTNVTISENSATGSGGGVSNSGGTLTAGNSIIFGNTAPSGADCSGAVTSADYNIGSASCSLTEGNDNTTDDPLLQPLALNGGDTLNYALGAGSPAIDAGDNAICPAADQRGNLRPVGGTCDIGAYEDGIGFFISDASLTEGNTGTAQMAFIVSRSFTTTNSYAVDYATVDGTAEAGTDYTAVPSTTLTFNSGDMTQTVNINILGDTLDEEDELFTVQLGNPTGGSQLGDASGTGTILDDDDPPSLTIGDTTVTEGDSGTVTAVFTATLSTISNKEITVDYATMAGSAAAGVDYVTASDTITFSAGVTEQTISITVNGDTLDEDDETFTVELSNANNVTLADSSGQATLTDDDDPPTLTIADVSVTEGNSGTVSANFVVSLDAASGKTITVDYATAADTATAGTDYIAASDTLTFTPGDTEETIAITVNGDTLDEFNETFQVNLSGATNATLSDAQAEGTINNDDAPPTATISDVTISEGDSGTVEAEFTVTLSAASGKPITINYSSADGSATAGEDYTAVPASILTFDPGDPLSKTISVFVLGDEDTEEDETFFINLTGSSNVTLGNSQATGTITNDDGVFIYLPFIVKP